MTDLPEITEAWTAHAGDVVFLRSRVELRADARDRIIDALEKFTDRTGVEVIVLPPDLEIVNPTTGASA